MSETASGTDTRRRDTCDTCDTSLCTVEAVAVVAVAAVVVVVVVVVVAEQPLLLEEYNKWPSKNRDHNIKKS